MTPPRASDGVPAVGQAALLAWLIGSLTLAAALGALSHWVLFEGDLFWHLRAGREIVAGQGVQSVERWSHTAFGAPWHNIEWLSTVLLALVERCFGESALGALRSVLVAAWIFLLCCLARARPAPLLPAAVLVPWIYLAAWFRLQMRPDLFAHVCFAGLLLTLSSTLSVYIKRIAGLALLVLWANLHAAPRRSGCSSTAPSW